MACTYLRSRYPPASSTPPRQAAAQPSAGRFLATPRCQSPAPPLVTSGLSSQISESIEAGRHGLHSVDYQARPLGLVSYTEVPCVNLFLANRGSAEVAEDLLDAVESRGVLRVIGL